MLKERIISTLKFFDLQDLPLTILELHRYLMAEKPVLQQLLNDRWEMAEGAQMVASPQVSLDLMLKCIEEECQKEVSTTRGFYHFPGREHIVLARLANYEYGIKREKLIKKYSSFLKHIPFVRGAGLVGSQALGLPKEYSDIDLFIISDRHYMWLVRTLVTAYFQVLGIRRHGKFVANRFCLNHYLAGVRKIENDRNLYTAVEYLKIRPLAYESNIVRFQNTNKAWLQACFSNAEILSSQETRSSFAQTLCERLLKGSIGNYLEKVCKRWQFSRIQQGEFVVATHSELSFHPNNRKQQLFRSFFEN